METDTRGLSRIDRQPGWPSLTWGLLSIWLIYSATALGWHLAHDPFLSRYACMVR